jgi:hypothetical protein
MFVIAKKKSSILGKKTIGVKNLWKIYRLAEVFCFFVSSTSGFGTDIERLCETD